MEKDYKAYVNHILDAISSIERYTEGMSFEAFERDNKTIDAVIRNFEIIGEAARNIPQAIKVKYHEVPWDEMYLLRNKVSHEYFGIDEEIIWDVVKNKIPDLIESLKQLMHE